MSAAEHLQRLPEPVQAELWNVARAAISMGREEKLHVAELLESTVHQLVAIRGAEAGQHQPVVLMLAACIDLITQIDRQAHPRQEGGTI